MYQCPVGIFHASKGIDKNALNKAVSILREDPELAASPEGEGAGWDWARRSPSWAGFAEVLGTPWAAAAATYCCCIKMSMKSLQWQKASVVRGKCSSLSSTTYPLLTQRTISDYKLWDQTSPMCPSNKRIYTTVCPFSTLFVEKASKSPLKFSDSSSVK